MPPDDERAPIGSNASDAPDVEPVKTSLGDWDAHFDALLEFERERGHCNVPGGVVSRGMRLGAWLNAQRDRLRKSEGRPLGSHAWREEKLRELVARDALWIDPPGRKSWDEGFRALERWAEATNGGKDYNAPNACVHDGVRVGTWLVTQRMRHRAGEACRTRLKPAQREKMDALIAAGKLYIDKPDSWVRNYELMLKWSRECAGGKHCNVTYDCVYEGVRLGTWLNTQRQRYRGDTTKNHPLSADERQKLQTLIDDGKLWVKQPPDAWETKFELLLRWGDETNGGLHYNAPQTETYGDVKLGQWLGTQRQRFIGNNGRNKPLRPDQRQKIQSLIDSGKLKLARTRAPNGTSPRRPKRTARLPRPDVPAPSAPSSSASKRAKPPTPKKTTKKERVKAF